MMIMFMIVATAALSVSGAVYAAVLTCLDAQHRLRSERLIPRAGNTKGVAPWVTAQCLKVGTLAPLPAMQLQCDSGSKPDLKPLVEG